MVEALFQRSRCFLAATAPGLRPARPERGHPPNGTIRTRAWWVEHFEAASLRHPAVHWQLVLGDSEDFFLRSGGRLPRAGQPLVWVLLDDRPGNTTQSIGLADELGWPYQLVVLSFRARILLPNPIVGASAKVLTRESRRQLVPPWPDLVIAAGRRTAPVARWIREQSRGLTRVVQLGRKGANPAEHFDLAITPEYAGLSAHPNRVETAAIPTRIRGSRLAEAAVQWEYLFRDHPRPRIALLVGGASHDYLFSPEVAARLARDAARLTALAEGSLFVTTSRRTGAGATAALLRELAGAAHLHCWSAEQKPSENPLLGYLALADVLVVTGESESMLAEATASGKSVHIYPLPRRRPGLAVRAGMALLDGIVHLAEREPRNDRGTTRPQRGLELFCSRLLARGYVRPNRDLTRVHAALVARGRARIFDGTLGNLAPVGHSEIEELADRVRSLMGAGDPSAAPREDGR